MGIEPTAGGCPATGFEVQERHQAANYSHKSGKAIKWAFSGFNYILTFNAFQVYFHFRLDRLI